MSVRNRLLTYLKEEDPTMARCIIISDAPRYRVILSYAGDKLLWYWRNGLMCPGSGEPIDIHPLAAETLVIEEISSFLKLEGVMSNEIMFLDPLGDEVDGIILNPPGVEDTFDDILKKEKIRELFNRFTEDGDKLSQELIGEAISYGVLEPFLSLVNV